LPIIGRVSRFLILNELNNKNSVIASKNWTLNKAAAAVRKKFDDGATGQSTTSTPSKFELGKSAKFDGAGV